MVDKSFADKYPRGEGGAIQFPLDRTWRRQWFPEEVFKHPAKANMFLIEELVKYLTKPGDTILDPFAGTGTLMIALVMGRHVICIELEQMFIELLHKAADSFGKPNFGNCIILPGDCRQLLPVPCDHAIFSPPYANVSVRSNPFTGRSTYGKDQDKFKEGLDAYSGKDSSRLNLGLLNPFYFGQHMKRLYQKLYQSVRDGGSMTVIIRDMMGTEGRVMLAANCVRDVQQAGFKLSEWFKYIRPGSPRTDLEESRGHTVIKDEDILIFHKPCQQ